MNKRSFILIIMIVFSLNDISGNSLDNDFSNIRNPFFLLNHIDGIRLHKKINLCGIMMCKKTYCAVLNNGLIREVVSVGDFFDGYYIKTINDEYVIVVKDGLTKKLCMS